MRHHNQGCFRQQVRFLQKQFLQDGSLPFSDILSGAVIEQALTALQVCWVDRVYTPLVTLCVFLGQTMNADLSCRAAVARLIAHRVSHGLLGEDRGVLPSQKTIAGEAFLIGRLLHWSRLGCRG